MGNCCGNKPSKPAEPPPHPTPTIATPAQIQLQQQGSVSSRHAEVQATMSAPDTPSSRSSPNAMARLTATLKISVRWNKIDVYIQFRPQPAKSEVVAIQAKKHDSTHWVNVAFVETIAKFKLYTVELEPQTRYQIRCLLRITHRPGKEPVPATTSSASIETRGKLTMLPGYEAIRDFDKRVPNEVSFKDGDILETVECSLVKGIPDQYAYVRNRRTGQIGLVPLICLDQDSRYDRPAVVKYQPYFYPNADKRQAAIMLMRPNVASGVFILRLSADTSAENCYALSVRAGVENGVPWLAKFKVYLMEDGYGCFIYPAKTFEDIEALINYYKNNTIQKGVNLTNAFMPPDDPDHQPTIEDIEIPKSSIEYGEKLGNGKFGNVYKGKLKHLEVAIKELIIPDAENPEDAFSPNEILEEALVMARLFHDNIVKLIAVCVDQPPYCLISEYMNSGSLKKYLTNPEKRKYVEFETVLFILLQISSGMAYLEARNFIHRDLRADNILIHQEPGGDLEVKIADFGLTRIVPEGIYESTSRLLPIRWTAPEALSSLQFSLKSDVWSFGIILYEVCTLGGMPYPNLRSNNDVQRSIQNGVIMTLAECQFVDQSLCPMPLYNVARQCWQLEPDNRPDFATLKSVFERFEEETEGQYIQDTS